jgi:hypothetical protein
MTQTHLQAKLKMGGVIPDFPNSTPMSEQNIHGLERQRTGFQCCQTCGRMLTERELCKCASTSKTQKVPKTQKERIHVQIVCPISATNLAIILGAFKDAYIRNGGKVIMANGETREIIDIYSDDYSKVKLDALGIPQAPWKEFEDRFDAAMVEQIRKIMESEK